MGLGLAGLAAGPCAAGALSISIDTSALAGANGRLDFTLLDGDFTANNSVTIANLTTNGVPSTAAPTTTIDDSAVLGQFLWDFTVGTLVTFDLSFTTDFAGGAPDRLTLNLLDAGTNLTLVDTELDFLSDPVPAQDALLLVDLANGGQVQVAKRTDPPTQVTEVPEAGTAALAALALLALVMTSKSRRAQPRAV
ncbi:MAG: hypothetical protein JNL87_02940 [Burkholderiaceae bacterium]|nr:hypothetical protein [Burkholderiaceae bacterium]